MVRRCIVKSCGNGEKCGKTEVSFFSLPKNKIMREGWLRKIGEVMLSPNIEYGKWFYKNYKCNTYVL
jgi:hypothetical protein